ncbi:MAG TPA: hypothetical protein VI791_02185 [Patescibacteria group bacterium]|nr:hypothetical protein [Patescibacteria group bacterium]
MTYVAAVRQRGQITIPDKIRSDLAWLSTGSIIHITRIDNRSILVKPYQEEAKQKPDWKKIWDSIALARTFKGERGNLSAFVVKDRESH